MKKYIGLAVVGGCLLLLCFASGSQTAEKEFEEKTKMFMQIKLNYAQEVLKGLTLEDYDRIAKNAQALSLITLESNWNILQTPKYNEHSTNFRHTTDRMLNAAKEKNLDGATLSYMEMTMRCVHCHKYVRDAAGSE